MPSRPGVSAGTDWETRAQAFHTDPRGVLFKSLPPVLNRYLHQWHTAEALRVMAGLAAGAAPRVVDVGCGYGRLSAAIRRVYPAARLTGIDISPTFARLYQTETGAGAVVSNLQGLPVRPGAVDLILLVTTLMYLDPAGRQRVVRDAMAALASGGRLLIIETSRSGKLIYSAGGLLPLLARTAGLTESSVDTGGHAFAYPEIERLVAASGGEIVRRSGVQRFTVLLPVLVMLSRAGADSAAERLLRICPVSEGAKKYSLHICYEVKKVASP